MLKLSAAHYGMTAEGLLDLDRDLYRSLCLELCHPARQLDQLHPPKLHSLAHLPAIRTRQMHRPEAFLSPNFLAEMRTRQCQTRCPEVNQARPKSLSIIPYAFGS